MHTEDSYIDKAQSKILNAPLNLQPQPPLTECTIATTVIDNLNSDKDQQKQDPYDETSITTNASLIGGNNFINQFIFT